MGKGIKKCKINVKHKNGKIIMQERGYCDKDNPDKVINRDTEMDIEGAMKSMDKIMDKLDD